MELFVDGNFVFDFDDTPPAWGHLFKEEFPLLSEENESRAIGPISHCVVYGSEVGRPCDNYCCS